MSTRTVCFLIAAVLVASIAGPSLRDARAQKSTGNWPKVIDNPRAKITAYQPRIESTHYQQVAPLDTNPRSGIGFRGRLFIHSWKHISG